MHGPMYIKLMKLFLCVCFVVFKSGKGNILICRMIIAMPVYAHIIVVTAV